MTRMKKTILYANIGQNDPCIVSGLPRPLCLLRPSLVTRNHRHFYQVEGMPLPMMPASNFMAPIRKFFADGTWREEKVAAYASVGILVFLTSFFWAPTRDFMHVVYGIVFFAPVLLVLLLRRPDYNQYGGWFTGLALLYAGYASISTLWSETPRLEFFAQHFLFLAVWLAGTAWLAQKRQLRIETVYLVLIVTGAVASVLYQLVFHLQENPTGYSTSVGTRVYVRDYGAAANPNTIGILLGATTLIAYVWWLGSVGFKQGAARFALLLLNALGVLATQSRGPILALAFTLALGFALYRGSSRKWLIHGVALTALVGLVAIGSQQEQLVSEIQERVNSKVFRPTIWSHLIKESVNEHLLFGKGLVKTTRLHIPELKDDLPVTHHAHSAYIDAFYWTGLLGAILMAAHLVFVLLHWSNTTRLLPLFLWFAFGCLTALVDRPGFFEHLNAHWFAYWIPAGLIGAVVMAARNRSDSG